jgi:hypothetical protein
LDITFAATALGKFIAGYARPPVASVTPKRGERLSLSPGKRE